MRKKLTVLLCMIACIFGLAACGNKKELTEYEQFKMDEATYLAKIYVQDVFMGDLVQTTLQIMFENGLATDLSDYTAEEIAAVLQQRGLIVDGNALLAGFESFRSAGETIGEVTGIEGTYTEIKDDQIIVKMEVSGEKKKAEAEIILSNDLFFRLESAALNPKDSVGELMLRATMNTVIGMGTVFAVLILISYIISGFTLIPKIQAGMAKKAERKEESTGIDNALAQIVEQESAVESAVEEADDCELVAVIAAAIAASRSAATTDGFVVRSVIRR